MESHNNLRLLFVSLCLIVSINAARFGLSPDVSPYPEAPESSGSSSAEQPFSYIQFFPSSISDPLSDPVSPNVDSAAQHRQRSDLALATKLHSVIANPEVKKICDSTDYPALCLTTVLPLVSGKVTVESVLEVAVKASNDFAKNALSLVKEVAAKPGASSKLLATLKDCQDGYDTAVDNFEKTMGAFSNHDIGTMRSMLSAVITYVGDCEDEFAEMQENSPLSAYAKQLTNMTSNCLAIASLMN